jgi:hypothetical protein
LHGEKNPLNPLVFIQTDLLYSWWYDTPSELWQLFPRLLRSVSRTAQ